MKKNYGLAYAAPVLIFLSLFLVVPLLIIGVYSFMKRDIDAGVIRQFSFEAYKTLFRADYARSFIDTMIISVSATGIALVVALPCAYFMSLSKHKTVLLLLLIIPFWTNFLVRIFAWKAILEANGFINLILIHLHLIKHPVVFLYNRTAVIVVLAYTYLPFAILPLYSVMEKFDFTLLEAARDLGCTHVRSLFRVLLPAIRPGITTALVFVFVPIFGQYVIPDLIGGGRDGTFMLGEKIANAFFKERNWPLPAAFSTLITVLTLLALAVFMLIQRKRQRTAILKMTKKSAS